MRTAVFVVKDGESTLSLLLVNFGPTRAPQGFVQRINERPDTKRSIELVGVVELSAESVYGFPIHTARTLEEAQSIALRGAWSQ